MNSISKLLAICCIAVLLARCDSGTNPAVQTITGHIGNVTSIAFSADAKTIASGSADMTIKLWDSQTGEELKTFSGHQGPVASVAFSPDGKTIASGSWDTTIKLWNLSK